MRGYRVIAQFTVEKYTVLKLDGFKPVFSYSGYVIEGKEYKPVSIYDAPECIAIEAKGEFKNSIVEFI